MVRFAGVVLLAAAGVGLLAGVLAAEVSPRRAGGVAELFLDRNGDGTELG